MLPGTIFLEETNAPKCRLHAAYSIFQVCTSIVTRRIQGNHIDVRCTIKERSYRFASVAMFDSALQL
jgi:hypothetical protein